MLEAIRRAISLLRQKQILHKLGVAISVTVIGIACYVLFHMLRGIDTNEVIEAIKSTETRQIALAALFVTAGFFSPTLFHPFSGRAVRPRGISFPVHPPPALPPHSLGPHCRARVFV